MAVLHQPAIYILTGFHCMFLFLERYEYVAFPNLWVKEDNALGPVNAILVFFLVFYGGNCYNRYFNFYHACIGMYNCAVSWAGLVCVYLPNATQEEWWNVCRHFVASGYIIYFELEAASVGGSSIAISEWSILFRLNLVHPDERQIVEDMTTAGKENGQASHMMIMWGLEALGVQLEKKTEKAPGASIAPFQEISEKMRQHGSAIKNQLKQPIPYPYYTTVMSLLGINLMLLAYNFASVNNLWSVPVYFVSALVLLGLKETAVSLTNPFGQDAVDFDVDHFMGRMMLNVKALLSRQAEYVPQELEFLGEDLSQPPPEVVSI